MDEPEILEVQVVEIGAVDEACGREGRCARTLRLLLQDGTERRWRLVGPSWALRVRFTGKARKMSGSANRQRRRLREEQERAQVALVAPEIVPEAKHASRQGFLRAGLALLTFAAGCVGDAGRLELGGIGMAPALVFRPAAPPVPPPPPNRPCE